MRNQSIGGIGREGNKLRLRMTGGEGGGPVSSLNSVGMTETNRRRDKTNNAKSSFNSGLLHLIRNDFYWADRSRSHLQLIDAKQRRRRASKSPNVKSRHLVLLNVSILRRSKGEFILIMWHYSRPNESEVSRLSSPN